MSEPFEIGVDHKEGKTLLTGGKYCDRDIRVYPLLEEKSVSPASSAQTVTPDAGFAGLSKVTVAPVDSSSVTVKSTAGTDQTISPAKGSFFDSVVVEKIQLQNKTVTPDALIEITTVEEFQNMAAGGSYKLAADLQLPSGFSMLTSFSGVLVGGGHTIGGITSPIFKSLSGRVSDLILEGSVTLEPGIPIGALASEANGNLVLQRVCNRVDISAHYYGVAGLIGKVGAASAVTVTLEDCHNEGDITGLSNVGGLVGEVENTGEVYSRLVIRDCSNEGTVTMTMDFLSDQSVGGIVGYGGAYSEIEILRTVNLGTVQAEDKVNHAGGLLGGILSATGSPKASIEQSVNHGDVSAAAGYAGGIAGYLSPAGTGYRIVFCYNTGDISAMEGETGSASGILGYTDSPAPITLTSCYNIGKISAQSSCYAIGLSQQENANGVFSGNCFLVKTPETGSAPLVGAKNMQAEPRMNKTTMNESLMSQENTLYTTDEEQNDGHAVLIWQTEEAVAALYGRVTADAGYDGLSEVTLGEVLLESVTVTENGTHLPSAGKAGIGVLHVAVPMPQLFAPTLAASGVKNQYQITDSPSNGSFVKEFLIYDNGSLRKTTTDKTFTLAVSPIGTHVLTAVARGDYFVDSEPSEAVTITGL